MTNDAAARAAEVQQRLLKFYGRPQWRQPLDPLSELVSTILSQNTNDLNRDRAFSRLQQAFPDWEAVMNAPTAAVEEAIRVAGLSKQKAPRIQQALRLISEEHGKLSLDFLADMDVAEAKMWLRHLKGVGPKTTAIILLFSLDKPAFPVDTHIHRVSGRLGLIPPHTTAEAAHDLLEAAFPPETYYDAHLNLIRLGRELCHPSKPDCPRCPLNDLCPYCRV